MKVAPKYAIGILAAVLLIVAAIHVGGGGFFVLDDNVTILENPSLDQSLFSALKTNPFRALSYAAHWVNFQVSGASPQPFHMVNAAIHILTCVMLFLLVRELNDDENDDIAPLIATAWFALNPVANFSALYITARSALLATFFTVTALLAYLRYDRAGKTPDLALAIASSLLALASKETGVAAPAMIVATGIVAKDRRRWSMVALPLSAAGIIYAILRSRYFIYLGPQGATPGPFTYLLTQVTVIPRYFAEMLWPRQVPLEMGATLRTTLLDSAVLGWGIVMIAAWAVAMWKLRKSRAAVFVLLWLPITLAPESSIVPLVDTAFLHRAYMPAVALAITFGFAFAAAWQGEHARRKTAAAAAVVMFLSLTASTLSLSLDWRSGESLHRRSVLASPGKYRARYDLGVTLSKEEKYLQAKPQLEAAIAIGGDQDVEQAQAHNALGKVLFRLDDLKGSLEHFEKARRLQPGWNDPVYNMGISLLMMERYEEAYKYLLLAKTMRHTGSQLDKAIAIAADKIDQPEDGAP